MATIEAASDSVDKDDASWYCPHCEEFVSKTTYYRHRRRFFNHLEMAWEIPAGATSALNNAEIPESECYLLHGPQGQFSGITRELSCDDVYIVLNPGSIRPTGQ